MMSRVELDLRSVNQMKSVIEEKNFHIDHIALYKLQVVLNS